MAKIGTAHIELKPVLDEEALALITKRIEEAVRAGVAAGMREANPPIEGSVTFNGAAPSTELVKRIRAQRGQGRPQ